MDFTNWVFWLFVFVIFGCAVTYLFDPNTKGVVLESKCWEDKVKEFLSSKGEIKYIGFLNDQRADVKEYLAIVDSSIYFKLNGRTTTLPIKNVLKVELSYDITEKNVRKFMSVRPTFTKHTIYNGARIIIFTIGNDYSLDFSKIVNTTKLEKFTLMVQREIKNLENNN